MTTSVILPTETKAKGRRAEQKFKAWLDCHKIPYLPIDQSQGKFPQVFKGSMKRPDFEIIIRDIGSILVDVKSQTLSADFENFTLDETELQKLLAVQTQSRPVWFTFGCPESQYNTWYWISLNDVLEKGLLRTRNSDNTHFRTIRIYDCVTIGCNDRLEKLVKSY